MTIERSEAEALIATALEAVAEQRIFPLLLAIETLTRALCIREPDLAGTISSVLKSQAESCRQKDTAGYVFLEFLAERAADPASTLSPDPDSATRTFLRLIVGGKGKRPESYQGPDKC